MKEIIRILWSKGLPFVVYRLPEQQEVVIFVQYSTEIEEFNIEDIESVSGFVMAPFESAITKRASILKPDLILNSHAKLDEIKKLPSVQDHAKSRTLSNPTWIKETYLEKAETVLKDLKKNKLQKLVLSRVIEKKLKQTFDPGLAFSILNARYSHSFNYVFHLPSIGSWLGATPETFLRIIDDEAQTVALAGTKPANGIKWTLKERREQAIVTDFIVYQLEKLGIMNYSFKGPETVLAGNVAHLSSAFQIPTSDIKDKAGKLINSLHPTPAVCGLPQQEAFEYIMEIEDHDRKFYAGFLGSWQMNGHSDLFVNLRCAEFDSSKMHIFVGGGLTSSSVAESEWDETVHKSKTLLSITENF
ncbi:MAG: chorismate-binding protein [Bacteroidetes bacterium]|nr:chorismate-binding protein [Bacteroidota bacterium]